MKDQEQKKIYPLVRVGSALSIIALGISNAGCTQLPTSPETNSTDTSPTVTIDPSQYPVGFEPSGSMEPETGSFQTPTLEELVVPTGEGGPLIEDQQSYYDIMYAAKADVSGKVGIDPNKVKIVYKDNGRTGNEFAWMLYYKIDGGGVIWLLKPEEYPGDLNKQLNDFPASFIGPAENIKMHPDYNNWVIAGEEDTAVVFGGSLPVIVDAPQDASVNGEIKSVYSRWIRPGGQPADYAQDYEYWEKTQGVSTPTPEVIPFEGDYVWNKSELDWTGFKSWKFPGGNDSLKPVLNIETDGSYKLALLDGEEEVITGLILTNEQGIPVLKNESGGIEWIHTVLDTTIEIKAGWVKLEDVVNAQEAVIGSGLGDSPRFSLEFESEAPRVIVTPWGEDVFGVFDNKLDRVTYMTGAGEVVAMYNEGENKIANLPDGVDYMFGYDSMFVFTTEPQKTVFFRRTQKPQFGSNGSWEFEDNKGAQMWAGLLRARVYNDWAALTRQPLPEGEAKYDLMWWITGDGAKFFQADQERKRTFNYKGMTIDLTDAWFFLPGKPYDSEDYSRNPFETFTDKGNYIVAQVKDGGENSFLHNTAILASVDVGGYIFDYYQTENRDYGIFTDYLAQVENNAISLADMNNLEKANNIRYWSK